MTIEAVAVLGRNVRTILRTLIEYYPRMNHYFSRISLPIGVILIAKVSC